METEECHRWRVLNQWWDLILIAHSCVPGKDVLAVLRKTFIHSLTHRAGGATDATALCAPHPYPIFLALRPNRTCYIACIISEYRCSQFPRNRHVCPSDCCSRQCPRIAAVGAVSRQHLWGVLDSDVYRANVGSSAAVWRVRQTANLEHAECMDSPYIRPTDTSASSLETPLY